MLHIILYIRRSVAQANPVEEGVQYCVGSHIGGVFGAVCSTLGVVLPSFIIILLVAFVMRKIINNRFVQGALKGVRPIILSLILSTALVFFVKVLLFSGNPVYSQTVIFDKASLTLLIMVSGFIYIYKRVNKKGLSPIAILLLCAVLGIILFIK